MSTKIYHGVKLTDVRTFKEAHAFAESLRPMIRAHVQSSKAEQIKSLACLLYDQYTANDTDPFDTKDSSRIPLLAATHRIMDFEREHGREESEYTISIAREGSHTLAIPFFPDNKVYEIFMAHPQVTAFGYWNNTDPEEGVSKKEWRLRERVWEKLFSISSIPSETMWVMRLYSTAYMIPDDEFMKEVPSVERRANHIADVISSERAALASGETEFKDHAAFRRVMAAAAKLKPDILTDIEGKIDGNLTMEDLEKELPKQEEEKQLE